MSKQFEIDMGKLAARFKEKADQFVSRAILNIGRALVERSPVGDGTLWKVPPPKGYVGGTFRNSWQYGLNAAPIELGEQRPDPGGKTSLAAITLGARGATAGNVHIIANNLPYGPKLEYGHSTQAPAGFVGITATEFEEYMDQILRDLK